MGRVWDDAIAPEDRAVLEKMYTEEDDPRRRWGERPALLIIDMSYGFVTDDYPHGYAKTGKPCGEAIGTLLAAARRTGLPILWTTGAVKGNRWAERGLWKHSGKANLANMTDPHFHEIYGPIQPDPEAEKEHVLTKSKPSGFFGTEMAALLTYYRCDTVIVTGMVTSGCVRATAVDAFSNNFAVIIPEEGVADRVQTSHKVTLFDLHMKYADVVGLQSVLDYVAEAQPAVAAR